MSGTLKSKIISALAGKRKMKNKTIGIIK